MFLNILILNFLIIGSFAQAFLVVNAPTLTVYDAPDEKRHIEDTLRYSTKVEITKEFGNFVPIVYRDYAGWVLKKHLIEIHQDQALLWDGFVNTKGAYFFDRPDTKWGPTLTLPFETPLKIIEELSQAHHRWVVVQLQDGKTGYIQRSQINFSKKQLSTDEMMT